MIESYDIGFGLGRNVTVSSHDCGEVKETHSPKED
jgi:hypothetical protein